MSELCYCGHAKRVHVQPWGDYAAWPDKAGWPSPSACVHSEDPPGGVEPCGCEGYQPAARPGARLEFGRDRMPKHQAETAPAWTPLEEGAR